MTERHWDSKCPNCGKSVGKIKKENKDDNSRDGYVTVRTGHGTGITCYYYHKRCLEETSLFKGNISDISFKSIMERLADEDYAKIGSKHKFN